MLRTVQLEAKTGYQASLLQLLTMKDAAVPIKQAASVRLKNIITESCMLAPPQPQPYTAFTAPALVCSLVLCFLPSTI